MASSEQIRAAREFQQIARQAGNPVSFKDARAGADAKDLSAENLTRLHAEVEKLKTDLTSTKSELAGMRITGKEFSGQGPRGIMFNAGASAGGLADLGLELREFTVLHDGGPATAWIPSSVPVPI